MYVHVGHNRQSSRHISSADRDAAGLAAAGAGVLLSALCCHTFQRCGLYAVPVLFVLCVLCYNVVGLIQKCAKGTDILFTSTDTDEYFRLYCEA